jgi:SNF2 family DNA or RNA helicase
VSGSALGTGSGRYHTGLGKTVQTLCYLAAVEREHRRRLLAGVGASAAGAPAAGRGAGAGAGHVTRGDPSASYPLAPSLIVAPLSTIRNWATEAAKWVPGLNVVIYHGGAQRHWTPSAQM